MSYSEKFTDQPGIEPGTWDIIMFHNMQNACLHHGILQYSSISERRTSCTGSEYSV